MRPEIRGRRRPTDAAVTVSTTGQVTGAEVEYAREKIGAALRPAGGPVLFVRARLTQSADPAVERPSSVHVTVELRGHPLQVTSPGSTMREAIDLAAARTYERLRRAADRRLAARHRPAPAPAAAGGPGAEAAASEAAEAGAAGAEPETPELPPAG